MKWGGKRPEGGRKREQKDESLVSMQRSETVRGEILFPAVFLAYKSYLLP